MAVRKTAAGLALKRWFKEKWKDEKGNPCGSAKNKKTKVCRPSTVSYTHLTLPTNDRV